MLPTVVDKCLSSGGMENFFSLVSLVWTNGKIIHKSYLYGLDTPIAHTSCLDMVRLLGTKLYDRRSPFYNILRTYYSLYGFPLELDVFSPRGATDAEKRNQVRRNIGDRSLIQF